MNAVDRSGPLGATLFHVPELDGLRGLAVLSVLVYHFTWSVPEGGIAKRILSAGWVGVDLFFVLSGYLITRGLVAPSGLPIRERLRRFWIRRALRIFPLYYAVLIGGALVAWVAGLEAPGIGYWLYAQNYVLAFDPNPLRWTAHFWSLAVEEQFYFLWPLLVLVALPKRVAKISVVLVVFAFVLRPLVLFGVGHHDPMLAVKLAYRAMPTRMDGLLLGALVALLSLRPQGRVARLLDRHSNWLLLGSLAILVAVVLVTKGFEAYDRRVMVIGYPALAVLFALIVRRCSRGVDGGPWRWLRADWLRACGTVSYGMYVVHWPLAAGTARLLAGVHSRATGVSSFGIAFAVLVTGIVACFVLARLSFRHFEQPFLRMKEHVRG